MWKGSLEISRASGSLRGVARALDFLSVLASSDGNLDRAAQARTAIGRAESLARGTRDAWNRLFIRMVRALYQAASGKPQDASARFAAIAAEAASMGYAKLTLEARLHAGELAAAGRDRRAQAAARQALEEAEREARAKGLGLVAGKARRALENY